jgi:hypothetical protein
MAASDNLPKGLYLYTVDSLIVSKEISSAADPSRAD